MSPLHFSRHWHKTQNHKIREAVVAAREEKVKKDADEYKRQLERAAQAPTWKEILGA